MPSTRIACIAHMLALLPLATAAQSSAPGVAPERGQLLYDIHCIQCHTAQMHWRDARVARDWPTLRQQVERWQGQASLRWPDEDIDAVARYLNETIYHYPMPQQRS
jgi:mono/diheme cytochrome c family protein